MAESENLDVLDDELEDDEEAEDEEESVDESLGDLSDDDDADEDAPPKKADKSEKRIRDLQAKADKAEAELNKMRKQAKDGGTEGAKARDPEVERWMKQAQEATRERIYELDPQLKLMKVPPTAITGETPEEMRASAKDLSRLIARISTQVRNQVLQEHGFSAPPRGERAEPARNYESMAQEEFDKIVKKNLGY